jgi:hypothetical protein
MFIHSHPSIYLYYYNVAVLNLNYEPHVSRQKTFEAITAVDL